MMRMRVMARWLSVLSVEVDVLCNMNSGCELLGILSFSNSKRSVLVNGETMLFEGISNSRKISGMQLQGLAVCCLIFT